MTPPLVFPETPAALYDLLRERFGIGGYDEIANPEPPFYAQRMREIAKLRAQLRARRATPRQVAVAAWYAAENGARIRYTSELFKLIPEAMRAYNHALAEQARQRTLSRREEVIDAAIEAGEHDWAARLIRADAKAAAALIAEWEARHG